MTETIEILKEVNANYFQPDKEGEFDDVNKALDVAIQALEEVEQYRALGTVEELKEAREKQIPKKPNVCKNLMTKESVRVCPSCSTIIENTDS
jgi:hypothetical protein